MATFFERYADGELQEMRKPHSLHFARAGLIDQKSINKLQHLEKKRCIAIGKITSQYPLFIEIPPQMRVLTGGETRNLI